MKIVLVQNTAMLGLFVKDKEVLTTRVLSTDKILLFISFIDPRT